MAESRRSRFGLAVWLPVAWIVFVLGCALSADWWAMPEADYMDFLSQGVPPGAVGEVPLGGAKSWSPTPIGWAPTPWGATCSRGCSTAREYR